MFIPCSREGNETSTTEVFSLSNYLLLKRGEFDSIPLTPVDKNLSVTNSPRRRKCKKTLTATSGYSPVGKKEKNPKRTLFIDEETIVNFFSLSQQVNDDLSLSEGDSLEDIDENSNILNQLPSISDSKSKNFSYVIDPEICKQRKGVKRPLTQKKVMGGVSANEAATVYGLKHHGKMVWGHLRAHSLGGEADPNNFLLVTAACNKQMLIFEGALVRFCEKYGIKFQLQVEVDLKKSKDNKRFEHRSKSEFFYRIKNLANGKFFKISFDPMVVKYERGYSSSIRSLLTQILGIEESNTCLKRTKKKRPLIDITNRDKKIKFKRKLSLTSDQNNSSGEESDSSSSDFLSVDVSQNTFRFFQGSGSLGGINDCNNKDGSRIESRMTVKVDF